MERGNLSRLLIINAVVILLFTWLKPFGNGGSSAQKPEQGQEFPLKPEGTKALAPSRAPEKLCNIWTPEFHAELSTRSATLRRFDLLTAKYTKQGKPIYQSTTPDIEERRQLRFNYRNPA